MKSETHKITEGAMIVAMIGAFLTVDRQMASMLSSQLNWLLSIPMIIYAARCEWKYSWMVFFATIIVSLMISPPQTIFYLFSALVLGIVYGEGLRLKWNQNKLLLWTIACTFISYLFSMYIFAGFFGYDLAATRNEFIEMLENTEIFKNIVVFFIDAHTLFNILDIASFLLIVIMESLCVHMLAHLIFIKLKMDVERIKIDLNFKYPRFLAVGGIISNLLFFGMRYIQVSETVKFILAFFYLTLFIVNLIYGMIVIVSMRRLPKWSLVVLLILPPVWPFVMILGIVDGLLGGTIRKRGLYGQTRKF